MSDNFSKYPARRETAIAGSETTEPAERLQCAPVLEGFNSDSSFGVRDSVQSLDADQQTGIQYRNISITNEFNFGSFRLLPAQRLLLKDDKIIHLGSRAMDILIALVERPSELVSKAELVEKVWPNTFVEESSLRVHISALRRALRDRRDGNRFIINIPGRGYRFVAPVTVSGITEPVHLHPVHKWYASVARDIQAAESSTAT